jgi:Rne/Rng family ribonuclease
MSKEIIINVTGENSRIAIVEDGELVELYIENPENVRTIGDIYLGRVRRILPGIKAAFVDIGQKQDAFLHFSDLSDNLQDLLELSDGKIPDWSKKPLKKAPKQDASGTSDLELETPEEQRAARRRRDLKRTRNRRGRGKKKDQAEPQEQEPQAKDEKKETAKSEKTGKRRAESARADIIVQKDRHVQPMPPQPPVSEALPDKPPEILPPEAVDEPPQKPAAETQPAEDKPKRRRGGRGRGRGRQRRSDTQAQPTETEQPEAKQPEAEQPEAQQPAAEQKPASSRSRGGRSRRPEPADQEQPGRGQKRSEPSRARSSRLPEILPPEANTEASTEAKADEAPAKPTSRPTPSRSKKTSPARSSRFVIDLTSKSSRVDRDDVEEEEEEEEKKGSSRNRRRGRRRGSQRSNSKKSGGNSSGGSSSGRSRSSGHGRGRSSSNGSSGRPEKHLKQDQKLIVKITKEPISSKGPRVSTDVSLAGRFLVLIPQADYVAVSKKIESSKERRRLRALARSLLPEGFGLIVRTVAEERDAKALDTDLRLLLEKWRKIEDQLREKPKPPKPLYEDVNMVSSIIRDLFSEDYDRIVVDDPKVHRNVKNYVQAVAPQMASNVTLHKSNEHVFRTYKIERDVRAAFESRVPLPGGGYLFIEHTEAMHVVDVNSGRAGRGLSQEENSLRVNLESAREIAKQLRLRDLGGIICVDFIDMRSHSARQKVYDELKKEFRKDRAVTKLLPMSDFGVVEITRQRLRPSITTTTNIDDLPPLEELPEPEPRRPEPSQPAPAEPEADEAVESTKPQPTSDEVVAHLDRWLTTYRAEVQDQHRKRPILVRVHPFLAAYLNRGIPSLLTRWRLRTRLKLKLDVAENADPLTFSVRDEKSGKNLTRKYDPDRRDSE